MTIEIIRKETQEVIFTFAGLTEEARSIPEVFARCAIGDCVNLTFGDGCIAQFYKPELFEVKVS